MKLMNLFFGVLSAGLMMLVAAPSFATSCVYDPYNHLVVDAGNVVPVNVPGIPWLSNLEIEPKVTMTNGDGAAVNFTIQGNARSSLRIIVPHDWAEGNTYRIVMDFLPDFDATNNSTNNGGAEFQPLDETIRVGPPLELEAPSGFDISRVERGVVYDGYIEPHDAAWVDIQANFLKEPPSNFYMFQTYVDDVEYSFSEGCNLSELWPGRTHYGPGADRLVVGCDHDARYLKPGDHEFRLQVRLMGTTTKSSSPTQRVNIPCAETGGGCSSVYSNSSASLLLLGLFMIRRRVKNSKIRTWVS